MNNRIPKFKVNDVIEDSVTIDRIISINLSSNDYNVINLVNKGVSDHWVPGKIYHYMIDSVDKDAQLSKSYIWNEQLKELLD